MRDVVVGRQPIFDRNAAVHGYELVFRPAIGTADGPAPGVAALMRAEVLFTTVSMGVDRLVGTRDLYVQASRDLLLHDAPFVLPPERTVIEIDADDADEAVVARCRELRADGYRLAVVGSAGVPADLLPLTSVVKIDVRTVDRERAEAVIGEAHARRAVVVATNIDLRQELVECDQLGVDLFQGNLLAQPRVVPGRALEPARLATVRLATTMLDSEVGVHQIEDVVRTDPAMSHQLLALAGVGAAGGMRRTVRSVREALVLVGWRRLQSWVALLLMAGSGDEVDTEAVSVALVRARACELLATRLDAGLSDMAFTAGLLSALDLLLHAELAACLADLPLDPVLRSAVLDSEGTLGALVADVTDLQFGRFDEAVRCGIPEGAVHAALFEALTWAVQVSRAFDEDAGAVVHGAPQRA